MPDGISLVSPSNDTTMSPPGSPTLWAAGNEPKKLTSPMVVKKPCSIPRLCHVTSATWCDTKPRVKATNFSVSYKLISLALRCINCTNRVLKCDITKKKFIKLWDLAPFLNTASLKKILAKNYLLIVIPTQNIKDQSFILPHINLSNFESVPNWRNWNKFWRVCMGCYQTLIPCVSIGNCNSELIFGMKAFFPQ